MSKIKKFKTQKTNFWLRSSAESLISFDFEWQTGDRLFICCCVKVLVK